VFSSITLLNATVAAKDVELFSSTKRDESSDLRRALDGAVKTYPSIAAARATARAAGIDVQVAKWQRFPAISLEGILLSRSGGNIQTQVVVDQPLWTGGRISGSVDRANARKSAALAAYNEAVLSIASSTTQAFFDQQRWAERVTILSESQDQHKAMLATMERRYTQEISPLSDLELARSRAQQIEQQLYQARAQKSAAENRLRELVGDPYFLVEQRFANPDVWPKFEDGDLISQIVTYSPVLNRLRFESDSANAEAKIARASIMPQLSGQYTYSEAYGNRIGLVLKAQSDGGFSRFAAAAAANQRVEASELQVVAAERQLRDQAFALLRDYESSIARLDGSVDAAGSARRVMQSYMRQFTSGRRTWLDVMNAVREANAADTDALEVRISAQSCLARILLLSGQWAPVAAEAAEAAEAVS
jgi:adhesin transport system outer membrane protein